MSRGRERTALLHALPRRYRREPLAVPTLEVLNSGSAPLTIEVRDQECVVTGVTTARRYLGAPPVGADPTIGVSSTFADLRAWLTIEGFAVMLLDAAADAVNPATLLEDGPVVLAPLQSQVLARWSQGAWRLLDPVARALVAAGERIARGLAQLNLLTAATAFADYWGLLTATVRRSAEADEGYTARQLHELLRPRENNEALATLLEEDLGTPVLEVRDLEHEVFRCNATPLAGYTLPGPKRNAAVAEAVFDGIPPLGAAALGRAHVAAGVTLFLRGLMTLSPPPSPYYLARSPFVMGDPPFMRIEHPDGTIGIGRIAP